MCLTHALPCSKSRERDRIFIPMTSNTSSGKRTVPAYVRPFLNRSILILKFVIFSESCL
jgi:hypothetical protein